MKKQIITISNDFSFTYEKVPLFHMHTDYNELIFEEGKVYGLFGENGSGKTTFLNLINSFLTPTTGKISYTFNDYIHVNKANNKNNLNSNLISNNIRRSFQVPFLIDELSIYDNIDIAKRLYKDETFINTCSSKDLNYQNKEITELLDLVDFRGNELAETLSYGQRRIISNLQVLFSNPQLIILDEPFSNLHINVIEKLKKVYLGKVIKFNTTIIIVEHTPANLEDFSDEIILIKDKKILKQG